MTSDELLGLIGRFHRAFPDDPPGAFQDFLRVVRRLVLDRDEQGVTALTDALWVLAPDIPFRTPDERAAFFRSFALFLAGPGPANDRERALEALEVPLSVWTVEEAPARHARTLRERATILGKTARKPRSVS